MILQHSLLVTVVQQFFRNRLHNRDVREILRNPHLWSLWRRRPVTVILPIHAIYWAYPLRMEGAQHTRPLGTGLRAPATTISQYNGLSSLLKTEERPHMSLAAFTTTFKNYDVLNPGEKQQV
jgi:hypothetical protein